MEYRDSDALALTHDLATSIHSGPGSDSSSRSGPAPVGMLPTAVQTDHKTLADLPLNRPSSDSNAASAVRFTGLSNSGINIRPTQQRRATKLKIGMEIKDMRARQTRVADKVLGKTPETQGKIVAYMYNFGTNCFDLYNPYAYEIPFLHELKVDAVIAALHENVPDPAQPTYIKNTKLTLYILVLPLLAYLT